MSNNHRQQGDEKIIVNPIEYDSSIPNISFGEFILEKVKQFGEKVSLIDAETKDSYTFSKVYSNVHQLATGFQIKFNLKPREKVAVILSNCIDYPIITLAINLCGATAILMNPEQTVDEFEHSVKLSSPRLWITTENAISKLENIIKSHFQEDSAVIILNNSSPHQKRKKKTITINDLINLGGRNDATFKPPKDLNPNDDAALILFSSGTTGLPKGVILTHENYIVVRRQSEENVKIVMQLMKKNGALSSKPIKRIHEPCFLAFLPFYHTMGINGVFDQLASGTRCVVLRGYTFTKFLKAIDEFKITRLTLAPPVVVRLSKEAVEKKFDLSSVTDVVCGGAPLSQETLDNFERKFGLHLKQGYGMTETTRSHGTRGFPPKKDSIGVVSPFYESKVVDVETNKTLGPFEEGEICVRGPMVMKGYIGNESATRGTIDSEGWLHSGDIGYYDKEGYFFITDRLKELIKYKGFQVSPVELEQIILAHPDVLDAAVAPVPDESAGELPRAFVVKRPGSLVTQQEIASLVAGKVSDYKKLRGGVIFVKDIPKTSSGKILRRQLKAYTSSKL